jgi:hypothetical protein
MFTADIIANMKYMGDEEKSRYKAWVTREIVEARYEGMRESQILAARKRKTDRLDRMSADTKAKLASEGKDWSDL